MREFDSLYKSKNGTKNWFENITPEAQSWLEELAVFIGEKGHEPVWQAVHLRFGELFPDEQPKTADTITRTVRKLGG